MSEAVMNVTMEIYVRSLKQRVVIGASNFFRHVTTTERRAVHNWYIAEFDQHSLELKVVRVDGEHQECLEIDITNVSECSSLDE